MLERIIRGALVQLGRALAGAAPIVRTTGRVPRRFCARCGQATCDGTACGYPPAPQWRVASRSTDLQPRRWVHTPQVPRGTLTREQLERMQSVAERMAQYSQQRLQQHQQTPLDDEQLLAPWRDVAAQEGARL